MYKRILVPVDGSDAVLQGLAEALELAEALQAQIRLLHVVNELIIDPSLNTPIYFEHAIESIRARGREALARAQELANEYELDVETEMIETLGARASDSIIAEANRWSADLIVMGTHGRRGFKRLALGSDAESVLRTSTVPVLMVRKTDQ